MAAMQCMLVAVFDSRVPAEAGRAALIEQAFDAGQVGAEGGSASPT